MDVPVTPKDTGSEFALEPKRACHPVELKLLFQFRTLDPPPPPSATPTLLRIVTGRISYMLKPDPLRRPPKARPVSWLFAIAAAKRKESL